MGLLEVYSDGSAEERVGRPGGWAFVIVADGEVLARGQGAARKTTSLVMEVQAAIEGLREVVARGWNVTHEVVLISDSSIALDIAAGRFVPKPKKYHALAYTLRVAALEAGAATKWVRAHAGHRWNEHVDALASEARRKKQKKQSPLPAPAGRGSG